MRLGGKQAEKGRSEENTGDHFRNDLGLTKLGRNGANDTAKNEDTAELKKELDGEIEVFQREDLEGKSNTIIATAYARGLFLMFYKVGRVAGRCHIPRGEL